MINKDRDRLLRIAEEMADSRFTVDSFASNYDMRWSDAAELLCRAESYTKDKIYTKAQLDAAVEAAIEATIDKVLACYSPDDTAQDWIDKIAAIRSMK